MGVGTFNPGTKLHVFGGSAFIDADATPIGTGAAVAQLQIRGQTNANKALWIGFDTTANAGMIQAGIAFVGWNNLILNQSGGNVGIGKTNPGSKLAVAGLPTFATNAAAITGGLSAGDFYTDGAGTVKVVF